MELDIPQQEGLTVPVNLNLQGDELHMNAGAFRLEWFPCGEEFIQQRYFAAVQGFLSGRLRIREHCRDTRVIKAELQEPQGDGWRTIGTWSTVHVPWPWGKTIQIKRNAQQSARHRCLRPRGRGLRRVRADVRPRNIISVDTFLKIKTNYGHYASWAVWADQGDTPKSNIDDLSVLKIERNASLLETLQANLIFLGLNISRPIEKITLGRHVRQVGSVGQESLLHGHVGQFGVKNPGHIASGQDHGLHVILPALIRGWSVQVGLEGRKKYAFQRSLLGKTKVV